ncbi:rhamnosyltransferase WsaF family glycosyltransferase [Methylobacterium sp. A54F]
MLPLREIIKRNAPDRALNLFIETRDRLAPPPYEEVVLHDYTAVAEEGGRPRLSLFINSIAPSKAFGGVTTGLEIFFELGRRTGADLRIIVDNFERIDDASVVDAKARACGVDPGRIEILPRTRQTPVITVRSNEFFLAYSCWIALNVRALAAQQARLFGWTQPQPYLYLIQEYEPQFYPFSSTHMIARSAYNPAAPYWGIFNSRELYAYFESQGHAADQSFVFEPRLSASLRPFLDGEPPVKRKRILVYGRPKVPRNCFPAALSGLRKWATEHPEFREWEVVSAGESHKPMPISPHQTMHSLGKLSLEGYADLLRTTAVGLSLMASPHPSYPPLEMAHFGILTITNRYAHKDLAATHDNIVSIDDIDPESIKRALAQACARFEAAPEHGWKAPTHFTSFLETGAFDFLDPLTKKLMERWTLSPAA